MQESFLFWSYLSLYISSEALFLL